MLDKAKNLAIHMLDSIHMDSPVEKNEIENIAKQVYIMFGSKVNFELNDLIKKIESQYAVKWEQCSVLQSNADHEEWLSLKRPDIKWEYWERYRTYLNAEKGWSTNLLKQP